MPVVKHRQLVCQVGDLGALRSRARWTSKSRFVAALVALVDNSLWLRRPQEQLAAALVGLIDNPPYSRSASASIRASTRPLRQHLLRFRQPSEIPVEARLYHVPTTRQPASNMTNTSTSRTATQTPSQLSYMRIQVQLRHKKSPAPT